MIEALSDALRRTGKVPHIFHSDQGSEYISGRYEKLLETNNIVPSYAKKSSPWENGYQESFYSQFKLELGRVTRHESLGELAEAVHHQIHYYNHRRIHTALRMSPIQFRLRQTKQKTAVMAI